jgi:hypothetical protein
MGRQAKLAGVAHDIAHHSRSSLSYINPHLAKALRSVGVETTEIDLLSTMPFPPVASESKPLRLALEELHKFVVTLLAKHGFGLDEVSAVVLFVTPVPWDQEGYLVNTRVVITSSKGSVYDSGWLR